MREAVGASVPCAGTGCAIERGMLSALAAQRGGAPFDGDSLTEDYELGLRINRLGGRGILARLLDRPGGALVAVEAYFPHHGFAAVRQKARWVTGIALAGWDRMGWAGGLRETWMRLRDRSAPIAAAVLAAGYVAILLALIETAIAWSLGRPGPILAEIDTPLARILTGLLLWRLAMRSLLVGRLYGPAEAVRAMPRMVVSNLVAIAASARAIWRYVADAPPRWDKTAHSLPDAPPGLSGSRSVRAFVLLLVGYAGLRAAWVWMPDILPEMPALADRAAAPKHRAFPGAGRGLETAASPRPRPAPGYTPIMIVPATSRTPPPRTRGSGPERGTGSPLPPHYDRLVVHPLPAPPTIAALEAAPEPVARRTAALATPAPPTTSDGASRWSGYAYLFHRPDTAAPATLAPAGQIGGSQAAARLAYRLDDAGHLALAARLATPLRTTAQAEAAIGADLIPVPDLRISIERRIAIGAQGRNAFAAYAAGGLYRALTPRIALDGYAQVGLVGARRRDPFADGALRLHHRTALTPATDVRIGAAAWGAAQPGAARIDLGPRAALTTRTARLPVTLALEGRLRVAGRARPGNGLALTVSTDF